MTDQSSPSERMDSFLAIYAAMHRLPRETVLEGLMAWAARIECRMVGLSVDCGSCPLRTTCARYGHANAPSEREWWPIGTRERRIIE